MTTPSETSDSPLSKIDDIPFTEEVSREKLRQLDKALEGLRIVYEAPEKEGGDHYLCLGIHAFDDGDHALVVLGNPSKEKISAYDRRIFDGGAFGKSPDEALDVLMKGIYHYSHNEFCAIVVNAFAPKGFESREYFVEGCPESGFTARRTGKAPEPSSRHICGL